MSIKHHLLRLARIGPHKQHPAVTEPDMGDLDDHRRAAQQDDFVAPVELIGLPRSKAQRNIGGGPPSSPLRTSGKIETRLDRIDLDILGIVRMGAKTAQPEPFNDRRLGLKRREGRVGAAAFGHVADHQLPEATRNPTPSMCSADDSAGMRQKKTPP